MAFVRILIVDDFASWRKCVARLLQQEMDLQIICHAADGLEAVERSAALQPDLVLLDIGLPNLNGLEAARQIGKISPGTKILFVTENRCQELARAALDTGAFGYLLKSDAGTELLPAVRAVLAGRRFVSRTLGFAAPGVSGET